MMIRKSTSHSLARVALVVVTTFAGLASGAQAQERLSAQKWSAELAASLNSNNSKNVFKLINFESLDQKFLKGCESCNDKKNLDAARELFGKGDYDGAIAAYEKVSKSSPYWFQAVEEKGWSHFRKDNLSAVLAQTKTLLAPQFADYVGVEPYFLQALAQLKSCNYKEVFETNRLFKEKQKSRLIEIQELAQSGSNAAFKKLLSSVDSFPLRFSDVGENAQHLPHLFYKDIELQRHMMRLKLSESVISILQSQVGFEKIQKSLENIRTSSERQLLARMKELATEETNTNFKLVQKINLIEIETIQRLHADLELDKALFKRGDFKKTNADQLVFIDDGRPWIDELDKYEVRMKSCPQDIRRKM